MDQIPIVDTHQHLWDLDQLDLPWLEEAPQLARNHRIDDYLREVAGHGVAKAVYMEVDVAPSERPREREVITALCRDPEAPTCGAVFGASPGSVEFPATVKALAANSFAKGARLVLHPPNLAADHCLQDGFVNGVRRLGANGLMFDVCIRPTALPQAAELARRCPGTTLIIDHCGNADPHIVAGNGGNPDDPTYGHTREQWLEGMQAVAAQPNTVCKISGIVARAAAGWSAADLAPAVNHCIDTFGEDRIVFGSDWPVCTFGAPLGEWITALREIISTRPDRLQHKLLHENATRIYQLR
jgi:L-fuconolactonase